MPDIGARTGSRILAEIGDGSRFANGSKLASYAGLAPVTRQSGSSLNRRATAAPPAEDPLTEALAAAAALRRRCIDAVVVDAEEGPTRLGPARQLADA